MSTNFAFAGLKKVTENIANSVSNTKVFDAFTHYLAEGARGEKAFVKEISENKVWKDDKGVEHNPAHKYTVTALFLAKVYDKEGNVVRDKDGEEVTKSTTHKILTNVLEDGLVAGKYIEWNDEKKAYVSNLTDGSFVTVQVVSCASKFLNKPWGKVVEKQYVDKDGTVYDKVLAMHRDAVYTGCTCVFGIAVAK